MQSVVVSSALFDYSLSLHTVSLQSKLSSSVNNVFVLYVLTQSCYFGSDRNYSDRRRWVIIPCYNRMDNDPYRDHHHARATKLHKVSFKAIKELVDPHGAHRAFCSSSNLSTLVNHGLVVHNIGFSDQTFQHNIGFGFSDLTESATTANRTIDHIFFNR